MVTYRFLRRMRRQTIDTGLVQGSEMVLIAMAQQLGPRLMSAAPSLWPHVAGPLLPEGGNNTSDCSVQPPSGDPQVS